MSLNSFTIETFLKCKAGHIESAIFIFKIMVLNLLSATKKKL